jgi:hypothetical protein
MSGFMANYGAGEERRIRLAKRSAIGVVSTLVLGASLWFFWLRDFRENRLFNGFLGAIQSRNYSEAYRLFGCTTAKPCPQYSMERFLRDWGPESSVAKAGAALKPGQSKSCSAGMIRQLEVPNEAPILLWIDRAEQTVGFAPHFACNPRFKM